jgi:hypothetical protein
MGQHVPSVDSRVVFVDRGELLNGLRDRPGTFGVQPDNYASLVTYLMGLDAGTEYGLLFGFQELVELKFGRTSNVYWSGLAPRIRWRDGDHEVPDSEKVTWLLDLLEEFFATDGGIMGARRLMYEWTEMARSEPWHNPDLLRFGTSPAPETVSLETAEQTLRRTRSQVLRLVSDGRLRVGRVGGELRITTRSLTVEAETEDES